MEAYDLSPGVRLAAGDEHDIAAAAAGLEAPPPAATGPAAEAEQDQDLLAYVELTGPVDPGWLAQLEAVPVQLLRYQPENSYLARAGRDAFRRARELPFVFRVTPLTDVLKPAPEASPDGPVKVWIVVEATGAEAGTILGELGALPGVALHPAEVEAVSSLLRVRATVTGDGLTAVLGHPRVLATEPWVPATPEDEVAGLILAGSYDAAGVPHGSYLAWLEDHGITGKGVTIGIVDNGVDEQHPAFAGRVKALDGGKRKWHGTFVAGHAAGNYLATRDDQRFLYGLGTAPAAELLTQDSSQTPAPLCAETVRETGPSGVPGSIQNNSWGMGLADPMDYGSLEATYDALVRNADPNSSTPRPLAICFSAGNAGPRGLTRPKAAKNILVTGNSESYRPLVGHDESDDINHVYAGAHGSSHGNCGDGRVRPDVVAPGEWTASANYDSHSGQREYIDAQHTWGGGSSGASGKTAGACALITQWWRRHNAGADPSPAMLRALVVNGAVDTGAGGPVPNRVQGWGRLNLEAVLADDVARTHVDQTVLVATRGDERTWELTPSDPARPVKVTLAWTDPPGPIGSGLQRVPAVVNRLGLRVEAGGKTYYGNHFAGGWSLPGPLPDPAREGWDNLQNVFLPAGVVTGTVKVTVAALNVTTDCLTGRPNPPRQDFALVVRNGAAASGSPTRVAVVVDDPPTGTPPSDPDGFWAEPGGDDEELDTDWWWQTDEATRAAPAQASRAGDEQAADAWWADGGPDSGGQAEAVASPRRAALAQDAGFLAGLAAGAELLAGHELASAPDDTAASVGVPLELALARLVGQRQEPTARKAAVVVVGAGSRFRRADLAALRWLAFTGRLYLVSDSPAVLAFLAQRLGRRHSVQFRAAAGRSQLPAVVRDALAEAGGACQVELSSRSRTAGEYRARIAAHRLDVTEADRRLTLTVSWTPGRDAPEVLLRRPGRDPEPVGPGPGGELGTDAHPDRLSVTAERPPDPTQAWTGTWELRLRQADPAADGEPEVTAWVWSDLTFRLDRRPVRSPESDGPGDEELLTLAGDGPSFSRLRLVPNVLAGQAAGEAGPAEVVRVPSRLDLEGDEQPAPGPEATAALAATPTIGAAIPAPRAPDGPALVELELSAEGTTAGGSRFARRLRTSLAAPEPRSAWRRRRPRTSAVTITPARVVELRLRDGVLTGLLLRLGTRRRAVRVESDELRRQLEALDLTVGELHVAVRGDELLAVIRPTEEREP